MANIDKLNITDNFAREARRLINQIMKNNELYDRTCLSYFGVTTSQGRTVLSFPVRGSVNMNELSDSVGVDNSTMTRMIDHLVDKGLVYRKADIKDRRLVRVGLTLSGKKLHRELKKALHTFYRDSLDEIRETERLMIIKSLERLSNSINKGLESCCAKLCDKVSKD